MKVIQLEVYEVQLGAAILIQLDHDGDQVRILADAGIHAGGYPRDHVQQKLNTSFQDFNSGGSNRIDLLLGSHYDKDHIDGLIDVASDQSIAITEAWLPPVADDTDDSGSDNAEFDEEVEPSLGVKFSGENGDAEFDRYIRLQAERCDRANEVRMRVVDTAPQVMELVRPDRYLGRNEGEITEDFFESQILDAEDDLLRLKKVREGIHRQADEEVDEDESASIEEITLDFKTAVNRGSGPFTSLAIDDLPPMQLQQDPDLRMDILARTALVKKSAARNAINAKSLKKLVNALNLRNIPIRFESISQGQPKFFVFNASGVFRAVTKSNYKASSKPKLTLLGPSNALISKHKKLLPIYQANMSMATAIPIKYVTPSNQLSYVAKFEFEGQSMLISGDTGFVDFKPSRSQPYFKALLDELDDLEIVQVAHHGGNNAHFYRVLLKAPFGSNVGASPYFLLSHAEHDRYRPSSAFDQFVSSLQIAGAVPRILFTSEPTLAKVQSFTNMIEPVVGGQGTVGDVKLEYDGSNWSVSAHAVKV